jgi:hypothetical protein
MLRVIGDEVERGNAGGHVFIAVRHKINMYVIARDSELLSFFVYFCPILTTPHTASSIDQGRYTSQDANAAFYLSYSSIRDVS